MNDEAKPLTPREINFCRNYAEGKTIARAYMDAGYETKKPKTASTNGGKLLNKTVIRDEIKRQQDRMDTDVFRLKKANAYSAVIKQGHLIDNSTPSVEAKMVIDALDRDGHKPKEQVEHSGEVSISLIDLVKYGREKKEKE